MNDAVKRPIKSFIPFFQKDVLLSFSLLTSFGASLTGPVTSFMRDRGILYSAMERVALKLTLNQF